MTLLIFSDPVLTSDRLAGVLIEPCSGVEPSVPSVRVVNFDGAVRVVSAIAFDAAKSPEGIERHPTAMLYAGTSASVGIRRTVISFNFRVGFGVELHGAALALTSKSKKVA
nr:hypothetical protein [uncultured Pseudomonas sp.]